MGYPRAGAASIGHRGPGSGATRDIRLAALPRVGILAADDSGRYIAANDAVCTLTGYSQDELLDMSIWDLSSKRNLEKGQRMWRHFLRNGGFDGEYHLRRKTSELIGVRCIAAAAV